MHEYKNNSEKADEMFKMGDEGRVRDRKTRRQTHKDKQGTGAKKKQDKANESMNTRITE